MLENNAVKLPEVIVFAGPNGSGKTTITRMAKRTWSAGRKSENAIHQSIGVNSAIS